MPTTCSARTGWSVAWTPWRRRGSGRARHRASGDQHGLRRRAGCLSEVDQTSPLFTPYFLYLRNCYDSLCLTPREAHLAVPYVHRDIASGLSWQDWQFAVETMSRRLDHVVVRDTIIFKRRRDFSLMVESAGRKSLLRSLPEMAIDRIRNWLSRARPAHGHVGRPDSDLKPGRGCPPWRRPRRCSRRTRRGSCSGRSSRRTSWRSR